MTHEEIKNKIKQRLQELSKDDLIDMLTDYIYSLHIFTIINTQNAQNKLEQINAHCNELGNPFKK